MDNLLSDELNACINENKSFINSRMGNILNGEKVVLRIEVFFDECHGSVSCSFDDFGE